MCCHQPSYVPRHPLLFPMQVGTALTEERFEGFLYDDTGENISRKNRSYCELTAQYWAWKNCDADYIGFFHYRRYLYPDQQERIPYRIEREACDAILNKLGYDSFAAVIPQYDVISPIAENMYVSVREHYAKAAHHFAKDLDTVEQILKECFPDYVPAMERYLSGTCLYFGNIFVMRRDIFHAYCEWLFRIMEEFDDRRDLSGYGAQEARVNGYLAERLFGIYLTHIRKELRVLELPRVHFENNSVAYQRRKLLNRFLPPGSRERSVIKKCVNSVKERKRW